MVIGRNLSDTWLENKAKLIHNLFIELRREHGVSTEFEIPMEYFAYTVENTLKKNGTHGDQKEWISHKQWREANVGMFWLISRKNDGKIGISL